jgi:anti-sigma-K factor RskA
MAEVLTHDEVNLLAAEYVVGLLEADEWARASRLLDTNGTMRELVDEWVERLSPLNVGYAAVPVPDIWRDLDRDLFGRSRWRRRLFWLAVTGLAVVLIGKLALWARLLG